MAEKTGIAWTDSTFNPWIGCTKVGPGCDHCYAEQLDKRHRWGGAVHWGAGVERRRTSEALWHHPVAWNAKPFYECLSCHHRFAPPSRKEGFVTCPNCSPLKGRMAGDPAEASAIKQTRRRVFCASLADVFDNEVDPNWRADLFRLIEDTPHLTWLLLTKRIGNAIRYMPRAGALDPLPNVWLGATIVNQEEADRDLPKLTRTPAAKRFVSYEPALGPVDFSPWLRSIRASDPENILSHEKVDWIIVGGESAQAGHAARAFDLGWAYDTVRQCKAAGVAVFVKQLGSNPYFGIVPIEKAKDRAGADPAEWPEDLRVQEFPA